MSTDDTSLFMRRQFNAPVERVYRAWTDPAQLSQWMGPGKNATCDVETFDLTPGGRYALAMRSSAGELFRTTGEFRDITPNERLSFTWVWDHFPDQITLVTLTFHARDGGTSLTLKHTNFNNSEARDNHRSGWTGGFEKLDRLLATHEA
jgi:uncharacterized protein YndB with AHSA1/START domain